MGQLTGVTAAGGSKTGKATSAAANEVGTGGRSWGEARGKGEDYRPVGNLAGKSSGLGGNKGVREAYGVAGKSFGVGGKEGGHNSYRVAENPRGDCEGVRGGFESPQGIDTPEWTSCPVGAKPPEWPPR